MIEIILRKLNCILGNTCEFQKSKFGNSELKIASTQLRGKRDKSPSFAELSKKVGKTIQNDMGDIEVIALNIADNEGKVNSRQLL